MFWHRTAIKLHRLNVPICISRCCMHLHTNSRGTFSLSLTHSFLILSRPHSDSQIHSHLHCYAKHNYRCQTQTVRQNEWIKKSHDIMYTYSRKIGFSMAINFVEEIWTCHKNEIRSCYQQNRSQLFIAHSAASWANIIIIIRAPTQRVINWPINVIFQMKIYCRHTHSYVSHFHFNLWMPLLLSWSPPLPMLFSIHSLC